MSEEEPTPTLDDEDITTEAPMGRRVVIGALGAAGATGAAVAAIGLTPSEAEAQRCSDSDGGRWADPAGQGRRCQPARRRPRRPRARRGCTDHDGGRWADAAGHGRHCGPRRPVARRCSDSDGGRFADPAGHGRFCR